VSTTVRELLAESASRLTDRAGQDARAEAQILLAHGLGWERAMLWARPEAVVPSAVVAGCRELVRRRAAGEPVAYLTDRRGFWTLELEVSPGVLIPRPETELLVEQVLATFPADAPVRVADLGTGSGAIALALAAERPGWTVVATDSSPAALDVARRNAARLGLTGVSFRLGDWANALRPGEQFGVVVSNPPYVADGDPHLAAGDLPWEPRLALVGGPDGLDGIRRLVPAAVPHLAPGGWLLLEHGADQGGAVRNILARADLGGVYTVRDLAGLERVSGGRLRAVVPPPVGFSG
jgi:release factor glutamine methyltransferase